MRLEREKRKRRRDPRDGGRGSALVGGVGVAVKEADRDRFCASRGEFGGKAADLGWIERGVDRAVDQDALGDLAAEGSIDEGGRTLEAEVVHVVAVLAGNLESVSVPAGDEQPDPGAAALDEGVRDEGGRVNDLADLSPAVEDGAHAVDDGEAGVVRGRADLGGLDEGAAIVDEADVREGTADVDPDAHTGANILCAMIDLTDVLAPAWPTTDEGWAKLIEDNNIPPAIVRRGIAFDAADPRLERLRLPTAAIGESAPHPLVGTFRDLTCPECERPVVVVYKPWGVEPRRAMVNEVRGGLSALGWHDRHPR